MDRLGYTAMTAAARTMTSLQVRANNLANVSTMGFKADMERATANEVEGYGYDSRHSVTVESGGVNMAQGAMVATGRELDFALRGPGLIALQGDDGEELYTRNGNLQVDSELNLTLNGRPVMGQGGPIQLPEYDMLHIGSDGTVSVVQRGDYLSAEIDRIRLVEVPAGGIEKERNGLLRAKEPDAVTAAANTSLVSGFLEASNVSAIDQLVATMSLNRLFETQVKMMKAAEDLSQAGNRMIRGS